MCRLSWFSGFGCPALELRPGASGSPWTSICFMALRANSWICCPQLHSKRFCSTSGHTPKFLPELISSLANKLEIDRISGTKREHKHKEFGQKPSLPDPSPKGPLTPQILYVGASFPFRMQDNGLHKEF